MTPSLYKALVLTTICWLCACSNYRVSLNDQIVYDPPPLFSEYKIPDAALKECVRATIEEQKADTAQQVKKLICPAIGIKNLEGIAVFAHIEQLGIAGNKIENISSLEALTKLKQIDISGNEVNSVSPLAQLKQLHYVKAVDNRGIPCESIAKQLKSNNITVACVNH